MNLSKSYNSHKKYIQCISIRSLEIHGQRQNLVIFRVIEQCRRSEVNSEIPTHSETFDIPYSYLLLYSDRIVISQQYISPDTLKKKERKNSTRTTLSANATCAIYAPKYTYSVSAVLQAIMYPRASSHNQSDISFRGKSRSCAGTRCYPRLQEEKWNQAHTSWPSYAQNHRRGQDGNRNVVQGVREATNFVVR